MNILQVCSAESFGGGERHVADLTRALIARGHRLHLAVRPQSPLPAALAGLPITWHELSLRNALDVISAQGLATIIRRERIDVLHAHVARDYTCCGVATRIARRAGRPVRFLVTRHHFNPIKSNPVYAWTMGEASALIAVSESVRANLLAAFPALAERVVVVPNWIDADECGSFGREVARARMGVTRRLCIGLIGQLTELKRQDLFIQAAAHLIKERLWADVDFLLVGAPGADDERYVEHLQSLISKLGVGQQVRFTGYIEDMRRQLAAFDIVVAPSENEAFSLALVEAMAAGCAVIATRVGGMAEIVEDEITGLFIEPGNLWSLISALSKLMTDSALRAKLGAVAQASVIERFDRNRVIDRIEWLYANDSSPALLASTQHSRTATDEHG